MSIPDFQLCLSSLERGKCRGGMVYMLDILYMLKMKLPGRRIGGRPQRRFVDVVKEDMKTGVEEQESKVRCR